MIFYIPLNKYFSDASLNLFFAIGKLLYNKDKRLIGAYAFIGPNNMVYTTNMTIHAPCDVYFCYETNDEKDMKKINDWAKKNGYKINVEIS